MVRAEPSQRVLMTGLFVSLVAHISLFISAAGFVRSPLTSILVPAQKPPPPPASKKDPIKLGIDDGRITSLAWLGFKEETPHEALQASVEQSAMSPAPGEPAPVAPPAQAQAPAPVPPSPPPPLISSRQLQEAAQALSNLGTRLSEAIQKQAPRTSPPAPPEATPSSGANTASGQPGITADKEAIGTSILNPATVRLGQVAAARGLDIQTRSPRWSITTMQTRRPQNPTLQITFGRDGKVIRAGFVTSGAVILNTGSSEVDEPLLSAVYSWTARGRRLAELASQDPNGEVTIVIKVILAG